jgi:CheY-like chemotaxis protein
MATRSSHGQGVVNVLLVEDHDIVAELMISTITALGYRAQRAATVQKAREMIVHGDFDVVLCDFSLPDGTANDLLTQLADSPHPPIILLTAYGSEALGTAGKRFERILQKPPDEQELVEAIEAVRLHR